MTSRFAFEPGSERRMAVLRYNLIMLAVGGLTMVAIAPRDQADAQSGQALAFAEHACLEYGITPPTPRCASHGLPGKRARHPEKHQLRMTTVCAPMV
jgi:hypothetical protein